VRIGQSGPPTVMSMGPPPRFPAPLAGFLFSFGQDVLDGVP